VEDQATDRAFRIGQHKNVVVHKFVTQGTVEEKIDAMLAEKAELSRQIIPDASEAWITEMDDKELMKLFTLSL
jgi:non-specific serine/threonine protein kinase